MLLRRVVLLVACLVILASDLPAVYARDTWVTVRSKHLLLIGNGSERDIRQVAARLEQFREVVSQVFLRTNDDSPVPTTVIVFKDDASYRPFKTSDNNAGYFQPGQDVNYITLSNEVRGEQDPYHIIFHEYTHLLVNNAFGSSPAWFNEGLAELYSTLGLVSDQRVVVGRPIKRHVTSLHQNPMLSLRVLFQVDSKSPHYNESQKQTIFYAESWALLHFLMLNKSGARADQLMTFVDLLHGGTPLEQAFQKAFKTSPETMEAELRTYVLQDRYRFTESSITKKPADDFRMTSSPISEAQVQAYLGDLLVHSNRPEAETYLQRAIALKPDLTLAHESLGMLRYRQGRFKEAVPSLEKAIATDSQNALVHFYYASALCNPQGVNMKPSLGYAPEVATKARAALKRSISLRPDLPDAYNLLAYVNLISGSEIDPTIDLLKHALQRSPGRLDFKYMLGQLYMHNDDYRQARPLLEQVVKGNVEAAVYSHALLLLRTMTDIENQLAEREAARRARGLAATTPIEPASEQVISDPSMELRESLHIPAKGETQVQGLLLGIECDANGLVFLVQTPAKTLRLKAEAFQKVRRTTFTADVKGTITCGPRRPENPVVVCYLPVPDSKVKTDGVVTSVEFVPADFKLVP